MATPRDGFRFFESLWKKYFADPWQWWDNRNRKISPRSPDFKHKGTKESLWLDGVCISPWVEQELRRRGLKATTNKVQSQPVAYESAFNVVRNLKACATQKDLVEGSKLHAYIKEHKFLEENLYVGSTLVNMYAKCGAPAKAQQVLKELPVQDAVMWNALIAGYIQQGQAQEALECYDNMQIQGYSPNSVTFICALKACGSIGEASKGSEIHDKIVKFGMLEKNLVLGSTLVDMYAKCGALAKAEKVLEELPHRNVITWNALIAGYVQQGQGEKALKCFDTMQHEGHSPDSVTFSCALKACGKREDGAKGEQIHGKLFSLGVLEKDIVLGNTLVDMYVKCGALSKAQKLVEELPIRNVVTWNALMAGYTQQEQGEEALKCFDSMQCDGQSPDAVTFTCALKACGRMGAVAKGEKIHEMVVNMGILEKNIVLGGALVDMYAKCGAFSKVQQLLQDLPIQDTVTWSALIAGYTQQGHGEEALKCFDSMQGKGLSLDVVTLSCTLKACGSVGAATKGEQVHEAIVNLGMLGKNIVLQRSLVDMYLKCGTVDKAQEVFEKLPVQDVVIWSAIIGGYAQQGWSLEAFNCFERMQSKEVKPDSTTLICMLSAFIHSGLLDHAEILFTVMRTKYGIIPEEKHCCCMVDLFGRAGRFNKALTVIEKMLSVDCFPVWAALLGASCKWGELKTARLAFQHAAHFDIGNVPIYACLAESYIGAQMQEEVFKPEW